MSLTEVTTWNVVKKQYRYKLKSFGGVFTSLIAIQVISILFSLQGTGSRGGSSGNFDYRVTYFDGNLLLGFMMGWAFIISTIITTKAYRYDDFSFVATRKTSNLANILFLFSASAFGAITVFLASHLLHVIVVNLSNPKTILGDSLTFLQLVTGFGASILYLFLFTSVGYFVGMLVQFKKPFVFILPAVVIGTLVLDGTVNSSPEILPAIGTFFGLETSFLLFVIKALVVSFLFFTAAIFLSNRLEVRA
ncbi:hypothetical protein [Fictibacillus sp. FJAT-27399]|uniref:hypothetical protein n=1 Tax=Fictibacillus sp. FJAT-27399 TaxID=1729689 RepID=UPI000780EE93|nr:hypothetical protein [Fictibacillus sp. FJAT-27399]